MDSLSGLTYLDLGMLHNYTNLNGIFIILFCQVPILLALHREDPLYEVKFSQWWIKEAPVPSRRIRISATDDDRFKCLLATLRVIVANEAEFTTVTPQGMPHNERGGINYYRNAAREALFPISTSNEIKALYLFRSICDDYLARYNNTLEEDLVTLNDTDADGEKDEKPCEGKTVGETEEEKKHDGVYVVPPFSNHRNALIQIVGEKQVLKFYLHLIEVGLSMLHLRCDHIPTVNAVPPLTVFNMPDQATEQGQDNEKNQKNQKNSEQSEDLFIKLENKLKDIQDEEPNPMILNYCKSHIYHIRITEERKLHRMKSSTDYSKPTIV